MTGPRLPDGFAVQVDRRVRVLGEGAALLGGSPTRLLRLAPAAQTMLNGGRLEVHDAVSAQLARTLLDATVAHPRPLSGPSHRDVTVVIPVRDNASGLTRLVAALRGLKIVVVDDGSDVGGGASIMGTLSGGGTEVISVGKRCLLGANAGLGISLGDDCVVEAGLYVTAGTKVTTSDGQTVKARELSGANNLLFRRNSVTGAVEVVKRDGTGITLNEALHAN